MVVLLLPSPGESFCYAACQEKPHSYVWQLCWHRLEWQGMWGPVLQQTLPHWPSSKVTFYVIFSNTPLAKARQMASFRFKGLRNGLYFLLEREAKSHMKQQTKGMGGISGGVVAQHQVCLILAFQALLNPCLAQETFHSGSLSCLLYAGVTWDHELIHGTCVWFIFISPQFSHLVDSKKNLRRIEV